jgi:hypothetical protein
MGGEIATVPENRSETYCGDARGAFLVVGDRHWRNASGFVLASSAGSKVQGA